MTLCPCSSNESINQHVKKCSREETAWRHCATTRCAAVTSRTRERANAGEGNAQTRRRAKARAHRRARAPTRANAGEGNDADVGAAWAGRVDAVTLTVNGARTRAMSQVGVPKMRRRMLIAVLRIVPLAMYLRSAACKFGIPIGGCDGPLCPVAIGKPGSCVPTANTAEQLAWCQHAWTPWMNSLLKAVKIPFKVRCSAADGYEFAKFIGALEVLGYAALWTNPSQGATILSVIMAGAIHFHMTFLKDPVGKLSIQFALLAASVAIMFLSSKPKVKASKGAATRRSSSRKTKRN